ncbi:MAG TPA: hypothetical protein VMY40_15455 [Anaerolineae bacterium]|nr:hypothetical protein [Anaerolineae bacterium]
MRTAIHKQTYSGGRAYRYRVLDEAGQVCCVAEPTGLLLPTPTRLVEFFDSDHELVGRLQPTDVASWRRVKRYELFVAREAEEPCAVIREWSRLVDVLLLRLPRYEVQLGTYRYVVRGSRYGERFYEIFRARGGRAEEVDEGVEQGEEAEAAGRRAPKPREARVGQIQRPAAGPSYVVETDAAPLCRAPTVLAAVVILIDLELTA